MVLSQEKINELSLENLGIVDQYNELRRKNGTSEDVIQADVIAAAEQLSTYEVQLLGMCAMNCSSDVCLLRDTPVGKQLTELLKEEKAAFNQMLEKEKPEITIIELKGDWELTKKVVENRLNVLQDPILMQKLTDASNLQAPDGQTMTVDEFAEMMAEHITPFKDEKAWKALHDFTQGNIRNALYITSYFMEVFPMFRSSDPNIAKDAEAIARGHGDIHYRVPGFRPSNPWEIQELDFHKLADNMRKSGLKGYLNLPTSFCSSHGFRLTDNPEDYAEWGIENGELIDVKFSDKGLLPPTILLALESGEVRQDN